MKICIISTGRSGSTSLYNLIKNHLGNEYYSITEPFNDKIKRVKETDPDQIEVIKNNTQVLIKTITAQRPENKTDEFIDNWLFEFFDKIILLDRLNIKEQAESFAYIIHSNNNLWHTKQVYKMSQVPKEFIKEWEEKLLNDKKIINRYSKQYNKRVYYYEDIFINKNIEILKEIFKYLELELNYDLVNEWIFSEEKKLRINENKTKLL
jgi:hypothetical protein